jgi:hypothetical protein
MGFAWLATRDPRVRDGGGPSRAPSAPRRSTELSARGGLALRSGLDARLVRTLAAALAEKGEFDAASDVLRRNAALFPADRRAEVEDWLALFARRQPIRAEPQFP